MSKYCNSREYTSYFVRHIIFLIDIIDDNDFLNFEVKNKMVKRGN